MLYGEINRQRLKIINEHVVADTIDYLEARFAFSEDWEGLEKWVHFAKDGEVYDIRLTDDCVRKADHLNLSAGIWKVYLHGNEFSGGKVIERITTNAAILKVEPTGTLDGEPFPEMPASVTEQILARLENVEQNGGGSGGQQAQIDDTLTKAGYAADAKAVGEKINQLSGEIADEIKKINGSLTEEQVFACREFAEIVCNSQGAAESFLFFTDQHYASPGSLLPKFYDEIRQIAAVYDNTPTSMCVSGGDWLNNSNTRENAAWLLGVIDGQMKKLFDKYVLVIGNHDTNYQGYEYMQSGKDGTYDRETHTQCILSREAIHNLWHRGEDASYFGVDGDVTKFYVFDTGLDWYPDMDDYRWAQVDWFATSLLSDDAQHSAALMHIIGESAAAMTPFANAISQIASVYNKRGTITLNGITYNFAGKTGVFEFMMGGHEHADIVFSKNNIPVSLTANAGKNSILSFDLVFADYAAKEMHLVRVGSGENRIVQLIAGDNKDDTNLFDIGESYEDYEHPSNLVSISSLAVNRLEGSLTGYAQAGGTMAILRRTVFDNVGTAYRLRATYTNGVELPQPKAAFIKLFDENGEIISAWSGGWTYVSSYSCFRKAYEKTVVSSDVEYLDETFMLPENAKTFQIGFQFIIPANGVANTQVTIRDISLEKI